MSETKTPYPPSPPDVPEGLTDYADSFARQQSRVLTGLFVFLIFYFAAIALFAMLGAWCAATLGGAYDALKVAGLVLSATFVAFLVKGFFKRAAVNRAMYVEVTDDDHPVLFDFLHQLCDELGAPLPHRVYLCPDVIAEYTVRTSLLSLVAEPRRELLVGTGLVNCTNLSEFKAVLAHELGHYCHLGRSKSYTAVAQHVVFDLIEGEDAIDRLLRRLRRDPGDRGPGLEAVTWPVVYPVSWVLDAGHAVLWLVLKAVALPGRGMVWEQEFHADLVAVSAAGSDAVTHALLRARFGMRALNAALDDLAALAEDRGVYTDDLFLHQDRAAVLVRYREGRPDLGLPPVLTEPAAGEGVRVFDPDRDDDEDESTPPMWHGHPPASYREENAKEHFVAAVTDHRSPWLLFDHPAELKRQMTEVFYRAAYHLDRNTDLTPATEVQALIDAEHPDAKPAPESRILESGELRIPAAAESINLVPVEEQLPVVSAPRPAAPVPPAGELRGEAAFDEVIRVVPADAPLARADAAPPVAQPASAVLPEALLESVPAAEPASDPATGAADPGAGARVGSDSALERLLGAAVRMDAPVPSGLPDTVAEGAGVPVVPDNYDFSVSDPGPALTEPVPAEPEITTHETAAPAAAETLPEPGDVPVPAEYDGEPLVSCGPFGSALIAVAETERRPHPAPPEFAVGLPEPAAPEPVTVPVAHPTVAFGSAAAEPAPGDGSDEYLIGEVPDRAPETDRPRGGDTDGSSSESRVAVGRAEAERPVPPPLTPEEEESIYTLDPRGPGGSSLLGDSNPPSSTSPLVRIGVGGLAGPAAVGTPVPRLAAAAEPEPAVAVAEPVAAEPAASETPPPRPAVEATPGPRPGLGEVGTGERLLPAAGRRPAVRITFVKPGEKSPIGAA